MITATDQATPSAITPTEAETVQATVSTNDDTSASQTIEPSLQSALETGTPKVKGKASSARHFSPEKIEKIIRAISKLVEAFAALKEAYNKQPQKDERRIMPALPQWPPVDPGMPSYMPSVVPVDETPAPEEPVDSEPAAVDYEPLTSDSDMAATLVDRGRPLERTSGFLWKPVSDKDGKLAVLLPPHLTGKVQAVAILSPDGSRTLQSGRYSGSGNGEREHFRFSKPGGEFPDGSIVLIKLEDGSRRFMKIRETSARVQK